MAFRQPTAAPQRQLPAVDRESQTPRLELSPLNRPIDDTQEWVLFSPTQAQTASQLSTEPTARTPGLSRLSDFGSWTVARSGQEEDVGLPDVVEDGDELDSLDDGLHAFREPNPLQNSSRFDQSGGSILPGHDGLGAFPASSPPVQEQLFSFEQYNPQKRQPYAHHRTASSVQRRLDALEDDYGEPAFLDKARRDRIEKWRVDSSKMMIEEIQKDSKSALNRARTGDREGRQLNLPDASATQGGDPEENESLWQRITKRVIKDLIGIDESTLAVILGENLAEEDPLSKTPTTSVLEHSYIQEPATKPEDTWEDRLIRRLAKELGILAQYLTGAPFAEDLPESATMEYAGIPVRSQSTRTPTDRNPESAHFRPTVQNRRVPTTRYPLSTHIEDAEQDATDAVAEIEYWERTPDLKTVLGYLSKRFMSRRYSSSQTSNSNIATTHTEDSLNRAAIIRQHHPLMSRSRLTSERRGRRSSFRLGSQAGARNSALSPSLKRAGTSCASWSTKRHKVGTSDGGSRNYWDIGGSIGSENAALGGVWGAV